MLDYNLPLTTSRNVIGKFSINYSSSPFLPELTFFIGELEGTEKPEEFVAVTGHIDCKILFDIFKI